jgi:hypothetical protein
LYVLGTTGPDDPEVFDEQYVDGNDMANYLVSRQADRVDADPMEVWERDYVIDFDDPFLEENWDDVRITALWNLLDPTVVWSFVSYVRFHLMQGDLRIEPLEWRVAEGYGLGLGTRGFLGPDEVTRFLDFYARTPHGVASAYVRDLKSSIDRSYGYGLGFHRASLATGIELSFQADFWDRPESLGMQDSESGANASLQLDTLFKKRAGFSAMAGRKSEGYFPGLPIEGGWYFSVGVLLSF